MSKDEMKNKISMALKDPILQQGFEIICKENAELKEKREKDLQVSYENGYEQSLEDNANSHILGQLEQAKVLLRAWYQYCINTKGRTLLQSETAQFLNDIKE